MDRKRQADARKAFAEAANEAGISLESRGPRLTSLLPPAHSQPEMPDDRVGGRCGNEPDQQPRQDPPHQGLVPGLWQKEVLIQEVGDISNVQDRIVVADRSLTLMVSTE